MSTRIVSAIALAAMFSIPWTANGEEVDRDVFAEQGAGKPAVTQAPPAVCRPGTARKRKNIKQTSAVTRKRGAIRKTSAQEPALLPPEAEPAPSRKRVQSADLHIPGDENEAGRLAADPGNLEQNFPLTVPKLPQVAQQDQIQAERGPLELSDVLTSVENTFPLLLAVAQERTAADGEMLSADGNFDLNLLADAVQDPMGYYEWYRTSIKLEQATPWSGTKFFGGYKLGVGQVPIWYGAQQTNDGGEFRLGMQMPLLRNNAIDKRRAELYKSRVTRQLAEPKVLKSRIEYTRAAAKAYWDWVSAGLSVRIAEDLLNTAVQRDKALERRVQLGDVAPIERVDNRRLIAQRQVKLVQARRKQQQYAIKLSLFYRNDVGVPQLVSEERLPDGFPSVQSPDSDRMLSGGIETARLRRPELTQLQLLRTGASIDLDVASNNLNPSFDVVVAGSQDVGGETPKQDKGKFQLEAGVLFEVPLQRRQARGQIQQANAKLSKLQAELVYAENAVLAEVQDAVSELAASFSQIEQTRRGAQLAKTMELAERKKFDLGTSTILIVNLRETATFDAKLLYVNDLADYFKARADYNAATGSPQQEEVKFDGVLPDELPSKRSP